MKKTIKIPAMRAAIDLVFGEYEECKTHLPKDIFNSQDNYLARTAFFKRPSRKDKLHFHVVIHSKSAAISVIAHEAVHAASFIFDAMGVIADFNNDENVAYLVQYICEEAEDFLDTYKENNPLTEND
jgi:hypothetical protein